MDGSGTILFQVMTHANDFEEALKKGHCGKIEIISSIICHLG